MTPRREDQSGINDTTLVNTIDTVCTSIQSGKARGINQFAVFVYLLENLLQANVEVVENELLLKSCSQI